DAEAVRSVVASALPVLDHVFASAIAKVEGTADDPRASARLVESLLPTLAKVGNDVVRSRYVARLARAARVEESVIMRLLAQRARSGPGGPRPVASPREVAQAKKAPAAAPDGESQLLTLLLQRREARAAGVEI